MGGPPPHPERDGEYDNWEYEQPQEETPLVIR